MSRQGFHPVPARNKPGLGCGLLNLIGRGATGSEDWMASCQPQVLKSQVFEGREGAGLSPEGAKPVLQNSCFGCFLNLQLGWSRGQPGDGMGQTILQAQGSYPLEPGLGAATREDMKSMSGENVVSISQPAELSKHGKHPEVELSLYGQTSCQKKDKCFRC